MPRRTAFVSPIALVGAVLTVLLLAACVPQEEPTPTPTRPPSASSTPSPTPTEVIEAVIPDLAGTEVFTVDAVLTADAGDRLRLTLTAYVPLETASVEARELAAYLAAEGDPANVWGTADAAGGVVQYIAIEVTAIEGGWPAGVQVPVTLGLGAQDTISGVTHGDFPGTPDLVLAGVGSGFGASALTGAGPISVSDWANLALQYGFLENDGYVIDSCEITPTALADDYAAIASWSKTTCVYGVPG